MFVVVPSFHKSCRLSVPSSKPARMLAGPEKAQNLTSGGIISLITLSLHLTPTPSIRTTPTSNMVRSSYTHCQRLRSLTSPQAPKTQPNPQKAASILAWFHKTAQAHSIKDLEKTLPQVSSINGMQVKDYLQALSDDNKIRVEKIGSGNWYWSFPADEKKAKDAALEKAQEEYNKANATVIELQTKVDDAGAARAEDEDMLLETGKYITMATRSSH
jgi:hypothetical protein